ncbi:L-Ala--D-Glu endopeptidase precursor [Oceanobacillus picturae]|uniref:L-Ala--D-Glu endopeptidase n=1 Tax=Oceanobacillus picturae TaxID=171693 RepID=W9AK95_9BACI|nr:M23 family metallopeptidase [Oceanobacillus picturae]GAQ18620.1 L-Ala--D-Glu endopeptidase precursor [Oceanobacillus picturae]CDO03066.1 L-Ala--D-Glu endopeptidase precursor [Oceanobacillus picturae]
MYYRYLYTGFLLIFLILFTGSTVHAEADKDIYKERMALFKKTEALTQIPWHFFAAMDNFERNIKKEDEGKVISIEVPAELWYGLGNSSMIQDENLITFFNGKGKDGDGDKLADPNNPEDILHTIANYMLEYGQTEEDIKIALWNYYKRDLSVQTIMNTAKVFKTYQEINLTDRDFPVSTDYNYSYRSTWGDRRGFGGLRIHEGTDIFAGYGTPVKSTTYGVIELMGWNLYGGWRIGIRDIYNIYHYYGHMNGYQDDIQVGQVVKPGDVLGSVGSTGYGPPGTSGKFPPHLHYGMYKDNGYSEWSFDPYPFLKKWERMVK